MSSAAAESRQSAAFARAAQARKAIADIVHAVSESSLDLAGAFARADAEPLVGRCFAVKVFEVVPGIGKVRARRTMDDVGLPEDVWLKDVPEQQRTAIITRFTSE